MTSSNVGGGGLLGGCASLLRRERPDVKIYGAQSVNTAAMAKSMRAQRIVGIERVATLADGLAGQIDVDAYDIGINSLDDIVTLTEEEIMAAIAWLAREHTATIDGSHDARLYVNVGAPAIAALLEAHRAGHDTAVALGLLKAVLALMAAGERETRAGVDLDAALRGIGNAVKELL